MKNGLTSKAVVKETLIPANTPYFKAERLTKIVIDAGHGGKDHGCSGYSSKEKDITLAIAKQLGRKINQYHPEIEVIFTREHDVFIPLFKRIDIANKSQADLFISIHCNAVGHSRTGGTETYIMGSHTAEENLLVAKRENASILYEKDFQEIYDGYSPHSPEGHIILSMFQNAHLEQSLDFATRVENSFQKRTPLKSRGVKQAGFVVLRQATMPSILIETGFLTNKIDESYLISKKGQDEIAHAIALAFTEYRNDYERPAIAAQSKREKIEVSKIPVEGKVITAQQNIQDPELNLPEGNPYSGRKKETDVATKETDVVAKDTDDAPKDADVLAKDTDVLTKDTDVVAKDTDVVAIIYKVQIAASKNKPLPQNNPDLFRVPELEIRYEENMYKYLTGHFESLEMAARERTKMRSNGFNGAFIVAYRGEERVKP